MTRFALLTHLLGMSVVLLRQTLRVELLNRRYYMSLKDRGVPILFALWHGQQAGTSHRKKFEL
jgi:lysophospholipid acyltransferase (LPLAT)-like uncharacterized protein